MKYISRGIVLDEETWEALNRLREIHGSYNKALRFMLSAGGVFEIQPASVGSGDQSTASNHKRLAIAQRPTKPPSLKPKERKGQSTASQARA